LVFAISCFLKPSQNSRVRELISIPQFLIPRFPPFTSPKRVFVKKSIYTLDNANSHVDTCKMETGIAMCNCLQVFTAGTGNFAYSLTFGEIGEGRVGV
jgi:hypothetical protein